MWLIWTARAWLVVGNTAALVFVVSVARLHRYFLTDVAIQIGLSQLGANTITFSLPVAIAAIVIVTIHVLALASLVQPLRRRAGTMLKRFKDSLNKRNHSTQVQTVSVRTISTRHISERLSSNKTIAVSKWTNHNAEITRLFMLWEVVLQTFQAYKISYLIASVSINRLIALVIVTNCWFSPILHYVMGSRTKAHIRLGRLLVDTCLDVVYNIAIPMAIVYPYIRDFQTSVSLYPVVFYYDDIWYISAVSELRQVFVTSWLDFVSKTSGCLSLVYRLRKVKFAIGDAIREAKIAVDAAGQSTSNARPDVSTKGPRSRMSRFLDLVLVLWGATICSLHLTSSITSFRYHDADCLLEMRPWGSLSYSCASFEINCKNRYKDGDRDTLEAILSKVDPVSVQNLIISHCPQLHVPSTIQDLRYLSMIKIYNSTITSWDADAALREVFHPQLQVLYFARVNTSVLPEGLVAADFPPTVWDIEFCITNLATFPSAITHAWRHVGIIALEGNPDLTELPDVLTTLRNVFAFNVGMNSIRSIREGLLTTPKLLGLGMNGNPIDRFPDAIGSVDDLHFLNFMETGIHEIPVAWMSSQLGASKPRESVVLYAAGSPICEPDSVKNVTKPEWLGLDCVMPASGLYSYPIDEEDEWRRRVQAQ